MKKKIGVIFGGRSEHLGSIQNALDVIECLKEDNEYEVIAVYITKQGAWMRYRDGAPLPFDSTVSDINIAINPQQKGFIELSHTSKIIPLDFIFPLVLGDIGEDGCLSGLLELAQIPYAGSSVLGSALGMDKIAFKMMLDSHNLPNTPYCYTTRPRWEKNPHEVYNLCKQRLELPWFVKPANMGSSIEISKVYKHDEFEAAMEEATQFDSRILIEQAIKEPKEIEVKEGTIQIPRKIGSNWQLVDYEINRIQLTPDSMGDPYAAYGLRPKDPHAGEPSLLLFMGTPPPTTKGALIAEWTDAVPGYSVGETVYQMGKVEIEEFVNSCGGQVEVMGQSLGGSLSLIYASAHPEKVSRVFSFNPPAPWPSTLQQWKDNTKGMDPKSLPKVDVFRQEKDFASIIGAGWDKSWDVYRVLSEKPTNPYESHIRAFGAQHDVVMLKVDVEADNRSLARRIATVVAKCLRVPFFAIKSATLIVRMIGIGFKGLVTKISRAALPHLFKDPLLAEKVTKKEQLEAQGRLKISAKEAEKQLQKIPLEERPGKWILRFSERNKYDNNQQMLSITYAKPSGNIVHYRINPQNQAQLKEICEKALSLSANLKDLNTNQVLELINNQIPTSEDMEQTDRIQEAFQPAVRDILLVPRITKHWKNVGEMSRDKAEKLLNGPNKDWLIRYSASEKQFVLSEKIGQGVYKHSTVNSLEELSKLEHQAEQDQLLREYVFGAMEAGKAEDVLKYKKEGKWFLRYSPDKQQFVVSKKISERKYEHTIVENFPADLSKHDQKKRLDKAW